MCVELKPPTWPPEDLPRCERCKARPLVLYVPEHEPEELLCLSGQCDVCGWSPLVFNTERLTREDEQ